MTIKFMAIVAHQDDFEFGAGGLFASLRKRYSSDAQFKILATTRGASGHHETGLEQTFRTREAEALKSAAMLGGSYECLCCLDGSHVPGQFFVDRNTLGGLWNAVRSFEPDYIFCPPANPDPMSGVHIDHLHTAQAVRLIAYQLLVPNAYPTINGERKLRVKYPVVINLDDNYSAECKYDIAFDISSFYDLKTNMALCHESQVFEWLPWTDGRDKPLSPDEFKKNFALRHKKVNSRYGFDDATPREFFRITRWGKAATNDDIEAVFENTYRCS